MTTPPSFPVGAPCWADLWTSDIDGSRRFYGELFGWEAQAPSEEFGGYFMFHRDGEPIVGAMGDMGPAMPANNTWKVYLSTGDIDGVVGAVSASGGEVLAPAMQVADLGFNAVFSDSTGAALGAWQPETVAGFSAVDVPGAPSWFELLTRDYAAATSFYAEVFSWTTEVVADTEEFRYSTASHPETGLPMAGLMDAAAFLPEGVPSHWVFYVEVDDVDTTVALATSLEGTVLDGPSDTPYGRIAQLTDPAGAMFKVRTKPS